MSKPGKQMAIVQKESVFKIRPLEAVIHLASFAFLSYISLPLITSIPATVTGTGLIATILYAVFYFLVLAALAANLMGRGSKLLLLCLRVLAVLNAAALVTFALALNQQNSRMYCTSGSGITTDCVSLWSRSLEAIVLSPFGLMVLVAFIVSLGVSLFWIVGKQWPIMSKLPFDSMTRKKHILTIVLSLGVLLLVGLLLLPGAVTRGRAGAEAEAVASKFQLRGELIYADTFESCTRQDVVIDSKRLDCVQVSYRIFKSRGELTSDLKNLQNQFERQGYATSEGLPQFLNPGNSGSLSYLAPGEEYPVAAIHYGIFGASNVLTGEKSTLKVGRKELHEQSGHYYGISGFSKRYARQFP